MANNLDIKDGNGVAKVIKTTETNSIHTPHNLVDINPNGGIIDAFGRLRVSEVTTQLDLKQTQDKLPFFFDEVLNATATATHSVTLASTLMETVASGDYAIRQTFQRANYQSGKSQQIFFTLSGFETQANVTKRAGYFSSSTVAPHTASFDGIYMENDGDNGVYLCVDRLGSSIDRVLQTNWNVDPLDGSGVSGITMDWSKNIIALISFEWLGVGTVFFSFVIDGVPVLVHKANHTNGTIAVPYMSSPNQPIRYEIRQSGAGSGAMRQVCATVGSEGALNKLGKILSRNTGATGITLADTSKKYALLGIRLQAAKADTLLDIINLDILETANKNCLWELYLNPTISAGTFTYNNITNDAVSVAVGNNTQEVTGGTLLDSGYVTARSNIAPVIENAIRLGMSIAGTLDTFVMVLQPTQTNASVHASISWRSIN